MAVPPDVPAAWLAGWVGPVRRDVADVPVVVADLNVEGLVVVTGCAVVIAVFATVVLDTGPTQGRIRSRASPDPRDLYHPGRQLSPVGFQASSEPFFLPNFPHFIGHCRWAFLRRD
ncbi:hypothetical protein ACQP2C_26130 [Micromonospora zamorensis]|uniref:hypothetical protein n=1 Tax=Micromonospora zamorensis TaxID=709883 RepID=UPI003D974A88